MAINSLYSDETQQFMNSLGMTNPYQMKPNIALEGPALGKGKNKPASEMTDAERMARLMQGDLSGQLDTGDKLTALSALLRSVSRGRTQTPDQVFRAIQQQKLQEVQGRIQLAEMQKQAKQAAEMQKYRQQLIDAETDPRRKAYLQVADADTINKIIQEQFKAQSQTPPRLAFDPLGRPRDPYTGAMVNPEAIIRGLPTIAGDDDYAKLAPGTEFVGPDGVIRRKP